MRTSAPLFLVALASLLGGGCGSHESEPMPERRAVAPQDTAGKSLLEPGALATAAAAPVTNWTGPGGKPFEVTIRTADPVTALARKFGTITLRTRHARGVDTRFLRRR